MKYLFSITLALGLIACNAQQNNDNDQKSTFTDVNSSTAREMISSADDLQILDVRTDGEVNQGMIEGARHIDISKANFSDELKKLDKSKPVLVYCAAGGRSKRAQEVMKEVGFEEVHNLSGGYNNWK